MLLQLCAFGSFLAAVAGIALAIILLPVLLPRPKAGERAGPGRPPASDMTLPKPDLSRTIPDDLCDDRR